MALTKIKSTGLQANVIYQALVAGTGVTLTANGTSQVIITTSDFNPLSFMLSAL
jgi:hypothetical protein